MYSYVATFKTTKAHEKHRKQTTTQGSPKKTMVQWYQCKFHKSKTFATHSQNIKCAKHEFVRSQSKNKQTNNQTNKQSNKQTIEQTDKQTNKQTNKQSNKQTNKQTIKQTNNPTNKLSNTKIIKQTN